MRVLGKVVTWLFAIQGFGVAFSLFFNLTSSSFTHGFLSRPASIKALFVLNMAAGLLAIAAAILQFRHHRLEKPIGILASLMSLANIPVGTVIGILGLIYYFFGKNGQAEIAPPAEPGTAGRIVTWFYGFEGVIGALLAVDLLSPSFRHKLAHGFAKQSQFTFVFFCYFVTVGLVSGLAALLKSQPGEWGRRIGILAAAMNLPVIPFGTVLGIEGLNYYLRRPPQPPPLHRVLRPGDGTHGWSNTVFTSASWVLYWTISNALRHLQKLHGAPTEKWTGWGPFLLLLFLALSVSAFIHECGHWIAGRSAGFHLVGFRLGPLHWQNISARWRLRFEPKQWLGAHVAMVPISDGNLRERAMTMIVGGPIGSFVVGITGLLLILLLAGPHASPVLLEFLRIVTAMGFSDSILNLIPVRIAVNYSDGARLWQLWRRGPWSDYVCALFYTGISRTTPLRPRDWPAEMMRNAADFARLLPDGAGLLALAFLHCEDRGEIERANQYLDAAYQSASKSSSGLAKNLAVERAYVEALYHRDLAAARSWMDRGIRREEVTEYWRTTAAILALEGDFARARGNLERGWALAEKLPQVGTFDMERRQLKGVEQMIGELENRLAQAHEPTARLGQPELPLLRS